MSGPAPSRRSGRRASRQRYMARRVVALGIVVLIVFGAVRVVGSLTSGDNSVADAEELGTTVATAGDLSSTNPTTEQTGGSTTEQTGDSTTIPVDSGPADTGPPTAENPAKVYIVGDSDAGTFGPYLQSLLDGTHIVDTELNYKVSSGLARPDFFDWPAELASKLPAVDPDIVVATFGGNDSNILRDAAGTDLFGYPESDPEGWSAEYQERVGAAMDAMGANGAKVIWVGIPNDDNPEITARLQIQDQAVRAEAAKRDNVVFIDTWKRFSGRDGNWASFVIDPRDGQGKSVRAEDGFHLNTNGAEILALDIAQAVRDELRTRGAAI